MRIKVPFYQQKTKYDCGPTALKMALEYLDNKNYSRNRIQDLVDSDKSGVTYTIGLANAAAKLGFKTEIYTTCLGFNPKNYELEFYQKTTDGADSSQQKLEKLKLEAVQFKVKMKEKKLSLQDILNKINPTCVPIILLDWSKIRDADKFIGHFVPIVGYTAREIYVHNQGRHHPCAYLPIKRDLFDKARKSAGTDQDITFIHKK